MDLKSSIIAEYKSFLDKGKTERECVTAAIEILNSYGYEDMKEILKSGGTVKKGSKLYYSYMGKSLVVFNIGDEPLEDGLRILGAHMDSPRLDIKQNPLYEDEELAYLDTHYYGGIKKYQWVTIPLAIHGVVVKKDGSVLNISVGERDEDPVFCITDLLVHLSGEQLGKNAAKVIEGEKLDVLIGGTSVKGEEKDKVKANILRLLKEAYDIEEADFVSAELEVVPAGRSRDLGFDRNMILAYGQDDRICAFTSLYAMLNEPDVKKTTCCLLVDKEEIGSVGATGMRSKFFENILAELMEAMGEYSELKLRRCLAYSEMLSSDVSAGYDPLYSNVFDKRNSAFLGRGIVFNKYTGSKGKSGSNDANAEYIARLRNAFDEKNISYQTAELGKVDAGGGGTIAYIMALYGMDVIDCGVAIMSMHAPWEVSNKEDIYQTVLGYRAFLQM